MTKPLYFYNGTTFELVGPTTPQSPIAYQTSAPTAPATGDLWIDSDGDIDTYNRQLTRYYYVATASQTTITGIDANGLTLAYVAGSEAVYVNGALQVRGQDYTATNGTSVVLSSGLAVNDVVEIFAYTAFTVANAYTKSETDGIAAAAAGLRMVVPTSVAVGSGSASVDANGAVTFTTASSVSLNGCFSSAYDNYRVIFNVTNMSGVGDRLRFQLRASGTNTATNYATNGFYWALNGAGNGLEGTQSTYIVVGYGPGSGGYSNNISDIINPFLTRPTTLNGFTTRSDAYAVTSAGLQSDSTSFDGFTLSPLNAVNITGTIRVYGYKN